MSRVYAFRLLIAILALFLALRHGPPTAVMALVGHEAGMGLWYWAGLGAATECVIDPGRHHFDVIEGLADPASPLMRRLLGYSG